MSLAIGSEATFIFMVAMLFYLKLAMGTSISQSSSAAIRSSSSEYYSAAGWFKGCLIGETD